MRLPPLKSFWMVIAGLGFGTMSVFVKLGAAHFSNIELAFYRSLIGLPPLFWVLVRQKQTMWTPYWPGHMVRSLSGFFSMLMFYYAISHMPLATAVTLNYTSPLFVALLSVLFLKERPNLGLTAALLLGFMGVVLLLRPSLGADLWRPALLGLGSGFLGGFSYLNVKRLGRLGEPSWRVVLYFTLISTIGAGLWLLVQGAHAVSGQDALVLLGMGACATIAQLSVTRAYAEGNTLVVGSLAYTAVVFSSLWAGALWGETLAGAGWMAIGLIIVSGIGASVLQPKPGKAPA